MAQITRYSRAIVRLFLVLLNLMWVLSASAAANPLPVDEAFKFSISRSKGGDLQLRWDIAKDYYLYRDHMAAVDLNGQAMSIETSSGLQKNDPNFGSMEVYYSVASATISEPGKSPISLTYQGCQEDGICYRPETRTIDPLSLKVSGGLGTPGTPQSSWAGFNQLPQSTSPQAPASGTFELAKDGGLVSGLLAQGGTLWVIGSFLVFGLLLAFTPCVFPMYPILAGALTRRGEQFTPSRGFLLSAIYAVSLATAFGLIGALAGWSGQNMQMVLQSHYTSGVVASIFVVLALSMFGLFELQLPSRWTTWISGKTGARGGPKRSVAVLGFSSVLIIGPCVTVPLAGALLYIAQTGNVMLGAASLFALGLGKSIPLIILGTLGGGVLPRAGAWMATVKRAFGFGFLASAIWMATPLLPARIDLVLWAAILMGFAVACQGKAITGNAVIAVRTLGVTSFVYGVIMMIGAATGGTDPLKPLAVLADRSVPDAFVDRPFQIINSASGLQAILTTNKGLKPTVVYFTADWCVSCRVIERSVLKDAGVRQALDTFELVKVDLSGLDASNQELMGQLQVAGPPTMVFFDTIGREKAGTRLVGNVSIGALSSSARAAREL